jgi:hypothetical protein
LAAPSKPSTSKPSVAAAKKPTRPGEARPTAQELDHALASLTDEDADEASFADLGDELSEPRAKAKPAESKPAESKPTESKPAESKPEPDAPTARSKARSSSTSTAAAGASGVPAELQPSRTRKVELAASRVRMTVEEVDDDEWPED